MLENAAPVDLDDAYCTAGGLDSTGNPFGTILQHFREKLNLSWHTLSEKTGVPPAKVLVLEKNFPEEGLKEDNKEHIQTLIQFFEQNGLEGKGEYLQKIAGISSRDGCSVSFNLIAAYDEELAVKGPRSAATSLVRSLETLDL